MRRKRALVTVYFRAPWGGLHENVWYAAVAARRAGWDVTVACSEGQLADKLRADDVAVHVVRDWTRWRREAKQLEAQEWDLVHTHPFTSRELGVRVARRTGAPLISTFHGRNTDSLTDWSRHVTALVAVSRSHADMLTRADPEHAAQVHVLPNAVRDELLNLTALGLTEKLASGPARIVVGSRLDPDKAALVTCVREVTSALRALDVPEHGWELELLGGGSHGATLEDQVRELAGEVDRLRVTATGWVDSDEVARRLHGAVIAIASGRGAVQSLAVGTPVVAFGSQGVYGLQSGGNLDRGVWGNFGGYPLPDGATTPVEEDVRGVLGSPEAYAACQSQGRQRVDAELRQSSVDRALLSLYEEHRRPRPGWWRALRR